MRARRLPAALLLWLLAALALGLLPRNPGWRPDPDGIPVHVGGTRVHADLVLPVRAAGEDLSRLLAAAGLPPSPYVAVGWGERGFYLATPTWADVRLATLLRAVSSPHTMVQLTRLGAPDGVALRLSPAEYRRLVATVRATIRQPAAPIPGWTPDDAFLAAHGHYSALNTCNQWVADTLATAGVRVGRWTPLAPLLRLSLRGGDSAAPAR